MRVAVLVIGILGSLAAGAIGGFAWTFFSVFEQGIREVTGADAGDLAGSIRVRPEEKQEAQAAVDAYFRLRTSIWFVLAAFPLGILGSVLANSGRGFSAGALLLVAGVGPVPLIPGPLLVIAAFFVLPLVLAGILAFFVRPALPPRDFDYGDH